jgi:hypothetical protein
MIELTKIVERSTKSSRPIAVSFSTVYSPCNHSSPEMNVVAAGTADRTCSWSDSVKVPITTSTSLTDFDNER